MPKKILFVDDEAAVLDGYKRLLYKDFAISTANTGDLALTTMQMSGPFAVVISDMRMPGMNGAQFLARVRQEAPASVRMLLTGQTEMGVAIEAVNEGNIFRFLTKPCSQEVLTQAIQSGLEQYRLQTIEKQLLEQTVLGCIKVLADVLEASNPEAFGRSQRIVRYVRHLATKQGLQWSWQLQAAASLSQLGTVAIPSQIVQQAYMGIVLSPEDKARYETHPAAACELIAAIPRMEAIAWIISQQLVPTMPASVDPPLAGKTADEMAMMVREAKMLRLAVAFDDERTRTVSNAHAASHLRERGGDFEKAHLDLLANMSNGSVELELRKMKIYALTVGMVIEEEIRDRHGVLKVAKGQEMTAPLRLKLCNLAQAGLIEPEVMALVQPHW